MMRNTISALNDGAIVLYNYYRQDWLLRKLAGMLETAFGQPLIEAGHVAVEVLEKVAAINLSRGADRVQ